MQPYSPERRTALVLCGTGAHGAYHAGVLRAVQEAGVKVDVVAGQGVGTVTAALAAIDGGARMWEADGLWKSARARGLYSWKRPLRVAAWVTLLVAVLLAAPLLFLAAGGTALPPAVPRTVLAIVALSVAIAYAGVLAAEWRAPAKRRAEGTWWWRAIGAPLDTRTAHTVFLNTITQLIPGAGSQGPAAGRRYAEVLGDNLGQPGFRELMLVATDLDTRRDVVAALLREPYRREFLAPRLDRERKSEVLDLAGNGRHHALDMVAAGLTPPLGCDPALLTFAFDSYWRGETHRLCDRPGAISRLLEELAVAGVSQALIVTAVSPVAVPHRLRVARIDVRQRIGDFLAAAEAAALRDALELARLRFDSVYVIAPAHNPVGPFDFDGAYDAASDRTQTVSELMDRAYEDAYRQFIEPVVGASGDQLARV